jgi:hypothetical protein
VLLALAATALVAIALLSDLILPRLEEGWRRLRSHREKVPEILYDPGRERRAEQRARELLRSCVNDEEWAMYRDLGFIRVWGSQADAPHDTVDSLGAPYAYLIYPHRPIVAYLAQTHRLLGEYCIEFPDETRPYGSARLPDSDDSSIPIRYGVISGAWPSGSGGGCAGAPPGSVRPKLTPPADLRATSPAR